MRRKQIVYDLITDKESPIYKYFSSFSEAYNHLNKFMKKNGFLHRQHSSYVSLKPMDNMDVTFFTKKLNKELPWLYKCSSAIDITDIPKIHNVLSILNDYHKEKFDLEKLEEVKKTAFEIKL